MSAARQTLSLVMVVASVGAACGDNIRPAADLRSEVIAHLWPAGLPTRADADVEARDVPDPIFSLAGASTVDRFGFDIPYELSGTIDVRSVAELYHPAAPARDLVIYVEGHCPNFCAKTPRVLEFLLGRGYAVLVHAMPLYGPNQVTPRVVHDDFVAALEAAGADDALRLFVEGFALSINYLEANYDFETISMMGLSGGGWSTTIYAGIDPRVTRSFPVAGSLPVSMRVERERGDAEQLPERPLYQVADYTDFYRLGAAGLGRRQVQILNENDPCCFATAGRLASIRSYEDSVNDVLSEAGDSGRFEVFVATDHDGHEVSPSALARIAAEIDAAR